MNVRANNVQCQKLGRRLQDIEPALRHLTAALSNKTAKVL